VKLTAFQNNSHKSFLTKTSQRDKSYLPFSFKKDTFPTYFLSDENKERKFSRAENINKELVYDDDDVDDDDGAENFNADNDNLKSYGVENFNGDNDNLKFDGAENFNADNDNLKFDGAANFNAGNDNLKLIFKTSFKDKIDQAVIRKRNEKKQKCRFCDAYPSNLWRHENGHKGVKYKCPECDSETNDKSNLLKHMKTIYTLSRNVKMSNM